jgi:hypothetical protein
MKSALLACLATVVMGLAWKARAGEGLPIASVEARYDEEQMIWTLGDQVWEFADIAAAYLPAKGEFNPATREAVWTLQIVRDLTPGETGYQSTIAGSPFKPTFLDADKTLLAGDGRVKITPISGKQGDTIRVTVRLPEEQALAKVALIRLEKRTEIGF